MFKGSRLHDLCKIQRGLAKELSLAVIGAEKGIDRYYKDGLNITVDKLEKIAMYTGKPVDYFLEYDRSTTKSLDRSNVYGDHNIVNSPHANDAVEKIENLNRVVKLQEEMLKRDQETISSKDELIKVLKDRINDQITIMKQMGSDNLGTK